jgi:hypothetical protein
LERLEKFRAEVVTYSEVAGITGNDLGYWGDEHLEVLREWLQSGLQIAHNYSDKRFEVYYDAKLQGYIVPVEFAPGWGVFMKKEDINYYFRKYGLPEIR